MLDEERIAARVNGHSGKAQNAFGHAFEVTFSMATFEP